MNERREASGILERRKEEPYDIVITRVTGAFT